MVKAVILAGGRGSRFAEETEIRPKPMIEIAGKPIIWHIMKLYAHYGVTEFIVCLGYKGYVIKEYFSNYVLHNSDVTIDARNNKITYHASFAEPWTVTLVDTGENTSTGGRLKRVKRFLDLAEPFCMTYGDGVANIDIAALLSFHRRHGRAATLTSVVPPGRYGALELDGDTVTRFREKPPGDNASVNGGYYVLAPRVLDRIAGDEVAWEGEPLDGLAKDGELRAFRHLGFWQPMDTLRDKLALEELWRNSDAPWRIWE
jgi:glucose-1-phosphate cytidylyltransferase